MTVSFILGVDLGSRNVKLILLKEQGKNVCFSACQDTGVNPVQTYEHLLRLCINHTGISASDIRLIYTTGYGRKLIKADKAVSEITCHAAGVLSLIPQARTIIDIGGQDCKVITLQGNGKVADFAMNDKCAAGTGRFLEMVALRLGVPCSELGQLGLSADKNLHLASTCVVFAESEIINLMAQNHSAAEIAHAVHLSVADRISSQINQLAWHPPVVFTGGVALNADLQVIFSRLLQTEIQIPVEPELTGALGAALLATVEKE